MGTHIKGEVSEGVRERVTWNSPFLAWTNTAVVIGGGKGKGADKSGVSLKRWSGFLVLVPP